MAGLTWHLLVCGRPPQHPRTPEERIAWQEQIRMIHLRSHLNQLAEKVKHASYVVDKTRSGRPPARRWQLLFLGRGRGGGGWGQEHHVVAGHGYGNCLCLRERDTVLYCFSLSSFPNSIFEKVGPFEKRSSKVTELSAYHISCVISVCPVALI